MSAYIGLQARVDDYLSERRRFGFQLRSLDTLLADFAKYVADRHHHGPLTVELMADWVRTGKGGLEHRKPGFAGWRYCVVSSATCNSLSRKPRCPRR